MSIPQIYSPESESADMGRSRVSTCTIDTTCGARDGRHQLGPSSPSPRNLCRTGPSNLFSRALARLAVNIPRDRAPSQSLTPSVTSWWYEGFPDFPRAGLGASHLRPCRAARPEPWGRHQRGQSAWGANGRLPAIAPRSPRCPAWVSLSSRSAPQPHGSQPSCSHT